MMLQRLIVTVVLLRA